jgi:hypothetical protein
MRTAVLDYVKSLDLGKYSVSNEAPYDESDVPLYIRNPKRIYVNFAQTVSDPFIQTLSGLNIANETTVIQVFLSSDAKLVPSNYESVIEQIKGAKDLTTIPGINRREVQVDVDFTNDLIVTTVELRYIKLT